MKEYFYDVMFELLPYELRDSKVYQAILKAYAAMFERAWIVVARAARNVSIDTAVEILPTLSRDVGMPIKGMSDRDAREVIRAAWISATDVVQEPDIIATANAFTQGGMVIDRTDHAGKYEFRFTSENGIPNQMDALDKVLKRMIGAEYVWDYIYKYMTWGERESYGLTEGEWAALGLTVEEERSYNG